jgi:hypothetical protein
VALGLVHATQARIQTRHRILARIQDSEQLEGFCSELINPDSQTELGPPREEASEIASKVGLRRASTEVRALEIRFQEVLGSGMNDVYIPQEPLAVSVAFSSLGTFDFLGSSLRALATKEARRLGTKLRTKNSANTAA